MNEVDRVEVARAEIERLQGIIATQKRDLADWKLRFRDRDAYCRLLEAELLPYRQVQGPEVEQESML